MLLRGSRVEEQTSCPLGRDLKHVILVVWLGTCFFCPLFAQSTPALDLYHKGPFLAFDALQEHKSKRPVLTGHAEQALHCRLQASKRKSLVHTPCYLCSKVTVSNVLQSSGLLTGLGETA